MQFGTPTGKSSPSVTTPATKNAHGDGAMDYAFTTGSNQSSATSSPASPTMPLMVDGANDAANTTTYPPYSPGPMTGYSAEDHYGSQYQYGYSAPGGVFNERSQTPQACV